MVEVISPSETTNDLHRRLRERLGYIPRELQIALEEHALPAIAKVVSRRPEESVELYNRSIVALSNLMLNMLPRNPEEGDLVEIEWPIELLKEKIPDAVMMRSDPEKLIDALNDHSLTRLNVLTLGTKPGLTPLDKELLLLETEQLWREPTVGEFTDATYDLIYPFAVHQNMDTEAWIIDRNPLTDLGTYLRVPSALDDKHTGVWAYSHQNGIPIPNLWELAATRALLGDQFGKVGLIVAYEPNRKPRITLFTRPAQKPEETEALADLYYTAKRDLRKALLKESPNLNLRRAAQAEQWTKVNQIIHQGQWTLFDNSLKEPLEAKHSNTTQHTQLDMLYRDHLAKLGAYLYEHSSLDQDDQALTLTEFAVKYQNKLRPFKPLPTTI